MDKKPRWIDALLGMAIIALCIAVIIHAVKESLFLYEYFRTF